MQYTSKACLLALTLLTTSCLKNQSSTVIKPPSLEQQQAPAPAKPVELDELEQLTLNELPIPLGFHLAAYEPNTPMTYCCYQGRLGLDKIESFIAIDAERNGWSFNNLATPQIKTYLIAKPGKTAIILLEQKGMTSILHVNLKTKPT